jgi:ketosteroid isomerase-like protein
MNDQERTVRAFYSAFDQKNSEEMMSLYTDDVKFSDPAFPALTGDDAKNMWRMMVSRAKELRVEVKSVETEGAVCRTRWEARYLFGDKKRPVHNIIDATMTFRDGKIAEHTDVFDVGRWSRQAIGSVAYVMGGTQWMRTKIQTEAQKGLTLYTKLKNRKKPDIHSRDAAVRVNAD